MKPYAYLRKSKVNNDRHVSWDVQEAAVRALAAKHGDTNLTILSDWSKSGRKGVTRPGYNELLRLIEAGEVSVVYSYSLSRLSRSLTDFRRLVDLCVSKGTSIRLEADDLPDITKASGTLVVSIIAAVAEFESSITRERVLDSMAARVARGDRLGIAPYGGAEGESIDPIIAAFDRAGSCYGAARLLNESGSRTRRGAMWTSKVVGDVLRRAGVVYQRQPRPGAKANADWTLFQLLTCQCGNTMTAMDRRSPRVTCYKARHDPTHPKPFGIAEKYLLPALMEEAAHLRLPESIDMPATDEDERAALGAKRERVLDMFAEGLIDKTERTRRLSAIGDALEALDCSRTVVELPETIDWSLPPKALNGVLRALWERVELGPDLMPVNFVWRVPEWRQDFS